METQVKTIANVSQAVEQEGLSSHSLLLRPASDINDIVRSWATYQELKTRLLDSSDWQNISGRKCIKKSGWRKLQTAFGISDEIVEEKRIECNGYFTYETTVKAAASNGRYSFGVGSCSSNERRFAHPEHDTRSTSHTRAKNRAISDLIGGGEVSAEEIISSEEKENGVSYANKEDRVAYVETIVGQQRNDEQVERDYSQQTITERQKKYLISLINAQAFSREEREERHTQLDDLTKYEASNLIKELSMAT